MVEEGDLLQFALGVADVGGGHLVVTLLQPAFLLGLIRVYRTPLRRFA